MNKKILISTGGSGGHVIPATIIYKHLENNFDVSMTSDFRGVKFLNKDEYNLKIFDVRPISKNLLIVLFDFLVMIISSSCNLKKSKDGLQNEKGLEKYIDKILTEKAENNGNI